VSWLVIAETEEVTATGEVEALDEGFDPEDVAGFV
jgi:hypothetical protein